MNFIRIATQIRRAGALLVLALLLLPGAVQAAELTKLNIGAMPITGHSKFFVAKERGFFAEEGIDAEISLFTSGADAVAAFRAEKLDAGAFGVATSLAHIGRGADALIIAGIMGQDSQYITKPENVGSITSAKDFRGKKIATVRLAAGDVVLRWALGQEGIVWKKDVEVFEFKNPTSVIEAVKSGQVDVGAIWGPYDQGAESKGFKVALDSAQLLPGHTCCRLLIHTNDLNSKADLWVHLQRALLKAERYSASTDPAKHKQTVEDVAKYVKLDKELIENAFYNGHLDQTTDPNAEGLQQLWNVMLESKDIESSDDVQVFIEPGPYRTALQSLIKEEPSEAFWKKALDLSLRRDAAAKGGGRADIHWKL
ncbi:MAG: ABC transporter substrate-binding protein [Deltaproteobacteria bacterium]|nr:ABC transporter substrate-binding protein [Deltaproteobacteria bacterium]